MLGTIKFWHKEKFFGFIAQDDKGPDVFVHVNAFRAAKLPDPVEGDRISFEIGEGRHGKPAATNIGKP